MGLLALLALFSIIHGAGSATLNLSNLAAGDSGLGEPANAVYLSAAVFHAVRVALGAVLLILALRVARRPSWATSGWIPLPFAASAVVIFDSFALTSLLVHGLVGGADPLLEWSATFAFSPWPILAGLLAVLWGQRELGRSVAAAERPAVESAAEVAFP